MNGATRFGATGIFAIVVGVAISSMTWSQQADRSPATAPSTAPYGRSSKIIFNFQDAPVDAVLDALSNTFGFKILKTVTIPGRITIINRGTDGEGLTPEQAVEVTNSLLYPLGYGLIEDRHAPEGTTTLQVAPIAEMKKGSTVPVSPQ
jgi:hypothetical protein